MNISITNKDFFWSYLGYFFNVGVVIILLPFILKFLPAEEIGLWYTFVSISVLIYLIDFGFSNTIIRNVSYGWGGAKNLAREGFNEFKPSKTKNFKLINEIYNASFKIYFIIAIIASLILFIPGTIYIKSLTFGLENAQLNYAWYIFATGVILNLFYSYWTSILKGIGAIEQSQKALVASKIFQLIITIIGLFMSYGLIAVSLGFVFNGIILRYYSRRYFIIELKKHNYKLILDKAFSFKILEIYRVLFHNAWRLGLVSFGAYLILQFNTLMCSSYLGLELTASYGLTLQLFTLLIAICGTSYQTLQPEINEACLRNNYKRIVKLISFGSFSNWILYIAGFFTIIFLGPFFMNLLDVEVELLPKSLIIFMGLYLFLENNHSMFASYITGQNKIPFLKASLISGFFVMVFSYSSIYFTSLGLIGLMSSQAIVQLCYNNWKWPYDIIIKYNLKFNLMYVDSITYFKEKFIN